MECWLLLGLDGISPSCNGGGRENHPSTSFDDDSGSFNRRKSGPDVVFVFQGGKARMGRGLRSKAMIRTPCCAL